MATLKELREQRRKLDEQIRKLEMEQLEKMDEIYKKRIKEVKSRKPTNGGKSTVKKSEIPERKQTNKQQELPVKTNEEGPIVKKLKVKTVGQEVYQMEYNGKYTRREIQKIGDALSKELEKEGTTGALQVTLKYPTGHYRAAGKSEIGEEVILYANEDYYDVDTGADQGLLQEPNHFTSFRIYVYKDIK